MKFLQCSGILVIIYCVSNKHGTFDNKNITVSITHFGGYDSPSEM